MPAKVIALILGLSDIGCGILFMLLCVPLMRRTIPMNHFYGFRIPKAFRSDEDWYAINAYGGRALFWWSLGLIASGIVKLFIPWEYSLGDVVGWLLLICPIVLFTTIPIVQTLIYARHR